MAQYEKSFPLRCKEKPIEMDGVWKRFKVSGDRSLRNVLVENYLGIVKYNAMRIGVKLPDEVETDDLISAGVFGLMGAIESFDLDRGVKFETYCAPRICGAILDELRKMDWVPRLIRSRVNRRDRLIEEIQAKTGDHAYVGDVIEDQYAKGTLSGSVAQDFITGGKTVHALYARISKTSANKTVYFADTLEDEVDPPDQSSIKDDLRSAINKDLTRTERLILVLYYYEEMTMLEIGLTIDLSESRVSQIHALILDSLRDRLGSRINDLWGAPSNEDYASKKRSSSEDGKDLSLETNSGNGRDLEQRL